MATLDSTEFYYVLKDKVSHKYIAEDRTSGGYVYETDKSVDTEVKRFITKYDANTYRHDWINSRYTTNAKDWIICEMRVEIREHE